MPFAQLISSPLMPDRTPVPIHYRDIGHGAPMIFLHGGWGYEIYPFVSQIAAFGNTFRIIIPDRTGYGRSLRLSYVPTDFHRRAAEETLRFLEALEIEQSILWGHSDGAVIAALLGLNEPSRFRGIILEAFHLLRNKPGSREFFETMAKDPNLLGERVSSVLSAEHGEDYWRELIVNNGEAWLRIANESIEPKQDLYDGQLAGLEGPALFVHGSLDPRTEPGELDRVASLVGRDRLSIIEGGGHSPHSERLFANQTNEIVSSFLRTI